MGLYTSRYAEWEEAAVLHEYPERYNQPTNKLETVTISFASFLIKMNSNKILGSYLARLLDFMTHNHLIHSI